MLEESRSITKLYGTVRYSSQSPILFEVSLVCMVLKAGMETVGSTEVQCTSLVLWFFQLFKVGWSQSYHRVHAIQQPSPVT